MLCPYCGKLVAKTNKYKDPWLCLAYTKWFVLKPEQLREEWKYFYLNDNR